MKSLKSTSEEAELERKELHALADKVFIIVQTHNRAQLASCMNALRWKFDRSRFSKNEKPSSRI